MSKVKVLIVDDSPTMRGLIASSLATDSTIEVVGQAGDAIEARAAIKALNPDVVTLDVEMPKMSGLEFLDKIMRLRPMPVIMVSTLTKRGAEETIQALETGAVDCIEKPRPGNENSFLELPYKVKIAATARVKPLVAPASGPAPAAPSDANYRSDGRVLAIGASTGGVEALISIISNFPANCPPTVITQHMPESFTTSFAKRLDKLCRATVLEATDGARLMEGHIYLAPGGNAHLEIAGLSDYRCRLRTAEKMSGHRPSVDVLFSSVAKICGPQSVGVLLTGMGRDGASGLLEMRKAGAATFAQDEATSVVYGMPKAAMEIGAVQKQLSLGKIGAAIISEMAAN